MARNPHGWFFQAHATVLGHLLSERTSTVLELGSWLGELPGGHIKPLKLVGNTDAEE